MQAIVSNRPGSPYLFADAEDQTSWAISPDEAKKLTVGQAIEIRIIDPADQFCRLVKIPVLPALEIFVAIDTYKVQLRCYTGNQTIQEATAVANALKVEALNMATSVQLDSPREPYIASTKLGVTIMCEIAYPQRQLTDAIYQQVVGYQKQRKWKLSRK